MESTKKSVVSATKYVFASYLIKESCKIVFVLVGIYFQIDLLEVN